MKKNMGFVFTLSLILLLSLSSAVPTLQSISTKQKTSKPVQDILYGKAKEQHSKKELSAYLSKSSQRTPSSNFMKNASNKKTVRAFHVKEFKEAAITSAISTPDLRSLLKVSRKAEIGTKTSYHESHPSILRSKYVARSLILPLTARQSGLTGDVCSSSLDCVSPRLCIGDIANASRCIPPEIQECTSDLDCVTGEVCANNGTAQTSACISKTIFGGGSGSSPCSVPTPTSSPAGGLTGDVCSTTEECVGTRICVDVQGTSRCIPSEGLQDCDSDSDCVIGEFCATVRDGDGQVSFCASEAIRADIETQSPSPTPPASEADGGLTFDVCVSESDCAGSRICIEIDASSSRCIPPDGLQSCGTSSECVTGEICEGGGLAGPFCLSEAFLTGSTPLPSPSPTSETGGGLTGDVCVSSDDCIGSRTCTDTAAGLLCIPLELQDCESDIDCVTGEFCASVEDGGEVINFCITERLRDSFPSPSPSRPPTGPPTTTMLTTEGTNPPCSQVHATPDVTA